MDAEWFDRRIDDNVQISQLKKQVVWLKIQVARQLIGKEVKVEEHWSNNFNGTTGTVESVNIDGNVLVRLYDGTMCDCPLDVTLITEKEKKQ